MSYALSLVAGTLTSLSPCILPALPLVMGSATQKHRLAPVALVTGLIASFTFLGVLLTAFTGVLGVEASQVTMGASILLIFVGFTLLVPKLQEAMQRLLTPVSNFTNSYLSNKNFPSLGGQFVLGALLGAVWSPCVGPTLGVAFGLASKEGGVAPAAAMMFLFGVGASIPMLLIAYTSKKFFTKNRAHVAKYFAAAKPVFGVLIIAVGAMTAFGFDKIMESFLLDLMPSGWLDFITKI